MRATVTTRIDLGFVCAFCSVEETRYSLVLAGHPVDLDPPRGWLVLRFDAHSVLACPDCKAAVTHALDSREPSA